MSAPTPINRNAAKLGTEYLGVSPPVAGAAIAAAAADHVHRVNTSSSEIYGFGRMLSMPWFNQNFDTFMKGALFSLAPVAIPKEWTIELWATQTGPLGNANLGFFFGWTETDGDSPAQLDGAHQIGINNQDLSSANTYFGNVGGPQIPNQTPPGAAPIHEFVQMDSSGRMWFGSNGELFGPVDLPTGAFLFTEGYPCVAINPQTQGSGATGTETVDEVRVSSSLRYPTSGSGYQIPAAPFNPDAETVALWHLDDVPYGVFFDSDTLTAQNAWLFSGTFTMDASVNGNNAGFAVADGNPPPLLPNNRFSFVGANSNVGPNSGSGAAATVESIQGQTGNFLLLDPGGNPLPVESPAGAQQIQVVGHLMGSPEYWY